MRFVISESKAKLAKQRFRARCKVSRVHWIINGKDDWEYMETNYRRRIGTIIFLLALYTVRKAKFRYDKTIKFNFWRNDEIPTKPGVVGMAVVKLVKMYTNYTYFINNKNWNRLDWNLAANLGRYERTRLQ